MNSSVVQLNNLSTMGGWFAPFTNRQYCAWFYWLMVVTGVTMLLHVGSALLKIVASGGKLYAISNPIFWTMFLMNLAGYIGNRLLYTMCLNSI
jgi:hypothetical protein